MPSNNLKHHCNKPSSSSFHLRYHRKYKTSNNYYTKINEGEVQPLPTHPTYNRTLNTKVTNTERLTRNHLQNKRTLQGLPSIREYNHIFNNGPKHLLSIDTITKQITKSIKFKTFHTLLLLPLKSMSFLLP
jgi:hypothetical protein